MLGLSKNVPPNSSGNGALKCTGGPAVITGKKYPCVNPHGNNAIKRVFLGLGNLQ